MLNVGSDVATGTSFEPTMIVYPSSVDVVLIACVREEEGEKESRELSYLRLINEEKRKEK